MDFFQQWTDAAADDDGDDAEEDGDGGEEGEEEEGDDEDESEEQRGRVRQVPECFSESLARASKRCSYFEEN